MSEDIGELVRQAYALDTAGREHEAIAFYDRAWALGGPADDRAAFLLGYGSTLRNVGRLDESLDILRRADAERPGDPATRCFESLTLHSLGRHAEALATMIEVALALKAGSPSLLRYARALAWYRDELRGAADEPEDT